MGENKTNRLSPQNISKIGATTVAQTARFAGYSVTELSNRFSSSSPSSVFFPFDSSVFII
jgi:hypothetical protein